MADILSDMLVRIKNGQAAKKEEVSVFDSKFNRTVCDVLVDEGFILGYKQEMQDSKSILIIQLKYYHGVPVIQKIERISKPSCRIYSTSEKIPDRVDGFGVLVMTTPQGVMSHHKAKKNNVGGEVLFLIN